MIRVLSTGLIMALSVVVSAAEHGGVYLLKADFRDGSCGYARCVAIEMPDRRQHFLTVAHTVGDNMRVQNNGRTFPVEEVTRWGTHLEPVVLLRQIEPAGVWREYPLVTQGPSNRDELCLAGFPKGRFQGFWTRVDDVQYLNDSFLITKREAIDGTSGGAVLNRVGELVGLVSSVSQGQTLSVNVCGAPVRRGFS